MGDDQIGSFERRQNNILNEIADWKQRVERRLRGIFQVYPKLFPLTSRPARRAIQLLEEFTLRPASKRTRAFLVKAGYEATGQPIRPALLDVAAAVELIQTYLLIHDDIIDRDEERRGGPTVHAALRRTLAGSRLERQQLANSLALLIGDLAFSWSMRLVAESDWSADRRIEALRALLETHETCVGGQYLDVLPLSRRSLTRRHVETIATRKTASYTFVGPLTAGARLGRAPETTIRALGQYGQAVGVAFQWIDDLDDIASVGRGARASNDLQQGKVTAVVLAARRNLSTRDRSSFDRLLLQTRRRRSDVRRLEQFVQRAQIESVVRQEARQYVDRGVAALGRAKSIPARAAQRLIDLGQLVVRTTTT